jgi:hypothetical protein
LSIIHLLAQEMQIFLQRSDSELEPLGSVALDDALELYRRHDWDSEILAEERLRSEGCHCCSPCMEWVSDAGSALIVIPTSRGSNIVYRSGKKHQFLGVLPTSADTIISVSEVPERALREILVSHYRGGEGLEDLITNAGPPTKIWS